MSARSAACPFVRPVAICVSENEVHVADSEAASAIGAPTHDAHLAGEGGEGEDLPDSDARRMVGA